MVACISNKRTYQPLYTTYTPRVLLYNIYVTILLLLLLLYPSDFNIGNTHTYTQALRPSPRAMVNNKDLDIASCYDRTQQRGQGALSSVFDTNAHHSYKHKRFEYGFRL